ncbi:MAG TPA: virulence factor [Acidimicrobiales bacterium]|jgi:hypothetical protein|nr:virulence factor [Acidimicrobiales bacterium]|tara:strand:+ start:147 stop:488 length:342 start_codon:yes stop_codon:yes gene_type:complete
MSTRPSRRKNEQLVVISWRDIPAQVVAVSNGEKRTAVLSDRFQTAIDRAAVNAGLTETTAYVGEWRRDSHPLLGDAGESTQSLAAELEAQHDTDRLEVLVRNGGVDPVPGSQK